MHDPTAADSTPTPTPTAGTPSGPLLESARDAEPSRRRTALSLAAITVGAFLVRLLLMPLMVRPLVFLDEWLHIMLARGFSLRGGMSWDGIHADYPSWLYILLVAPFARALPNVEAHAAIVVLGSSIISLTIPASYLLARQFASRRRALEAAILVSLLPHLMYGALAMTDVLFLPVAVLATLAAVRALAEDSSIGRRIGAGAMLGVLFHIKPIGLAFAPAFGMAAIALAALPRTRDESSPRFRRVADTIVRHVPTLAAWVLVLSIRIAEAAWIEGNPAPFTSRSFFGLYLADAASVDATGQAGGIGLALALTAGTVIVLIVACGFSPARSWLGALSRTEPAGSRSTAFFLGALAPLLAFSTTRHGMQFDMTLHSERYLMSIIPGLICLHAARSGVDSNPPGRVWIAVSVVLAAIAVGLGANPQNTLFSENPALSGALVLLGRGTDSAGAVALFSLLLLASLALHVRPIPGFRMAGLATFLIACNVGWYIVHRGLLEESTRPERSVAEAVAEAAGPDERLLILHDGMDQTLFHRVGFRNPAGIVHFDTGTRPWFGRPIEVRADGTLRTLQAKGTLLLAASGWKFEQTPEADFGVCALYRLDGDAPLALAPESFDELRRAKAEREIANPDLASLGDRIRLEFLDVRVPSIVAPGSTFRAQIILKNSGDSPLPSGAGCSLGYHWQNPDRNNGSWESVVWDDGYAKRLPDGLAPGQPAMLEMQVRAPEERHERWFLAIAPLLVVGERRVWLDSEANTTGRWVTVGDRPIEASATPAPPDHLPFSPENFQSLVRVEFIEVDLPEAFKAGEKSRVRCVVRNDSPFPLPASEYRAGLGYHWTDPDGTGSWTAILWDDGNHALLEQPLDPGRRHVFEWDVTAPANTGDALVLELGVLLKPPDGAIVWGPGAESHVARVGVEP